MHSKKLSLIGFLLVIWVSLSRAQTGHEQQGMLFKAGTSLRLSGARIVNTRTSATAQSNLYGGFSIPASVNDTLAVTCDGYTSTQFVITDLLDIVLFLQPVYSLPELVLKENTVLADLNSVKRGYDSHTAFGVAAGPKGRWSAAEQKQKAAPFPRRPS